MSKIKTFLEHSIERLKNQEQVEEAKVEFKRKWYDFSNKENRKITESEFLKDLVSIANTPGPEGYLIIGVDEKSGMLFNSPLNNSGLGDLTNIRNLIVKYVDLPVRFDFQEIKLDEKILSIFRVPPSLDKPHVIKLYISKSGAEHQNFIPVRKLTGIFPASRSDIEFMYYDRKNIEPEYALEIKTFKPHLAFNGFTSTRKIETNLELCFQNFGRKPIALGEITLILDIPPEVDIDEPLNFVMHSFVIPNDKAPTEQHSYFIIPSNHIIKSIIRFKLNRVNDVNELLTRLRSLEEFNFLIEAKDIDENVYNSKTIRYYKFEE